MNGRLIALSMSMLVLFGACSRSTDNLIRDLYSDSSMARRSAASKLMMRTGDHELVGKLVGLLKGDDERVSYIAMQILGSLADSSAVEPLGAVLDNPNPDYRATACWSLGTIGHDSAFPSLLKGISDESADVRYAAVIALGHLYYPPAVEHLYPMFRDEADSVRVRAIQSIYNYRLVEGANVMAADFAIPLADRVETVRYVAVQALGGAWEEARGWVFADSTVAGELLVEALRDQSKYVRIEAIMSLGKISYNDAIPVLKAMYNISSVDEEVAISEAIKKINGETFPPPSGGTN